MATLQRHQHHPGSSGGWVFSAPEMPALAKQLPSLRGLTLGYMGQASRFHASLYFPSLRTGMCSTQLLARVISLPFQIFHTYLIIFYTKCSLLKYLVWFLSPDWTLTAASLSLSDMPGRENSQHFHLIKDTSACSMGCLLKACKRQLIFERDTLGTTVTIRTLKSLHFSLSHSI